MALTSPIPAPDADGLRCDVVLSIWDQIAMRSYMRCIFCFPLDTAAIPAALDHLRASLSRLARQRPDFAASLEERDDPPRKGIVHLCFRPGDEIPFEVVDIPASASDGDAVAEDWWADGRTYEDLRTAEFPPLAFVHPRFKGPSTTTRVPVAQVTAYLVPGGLLMAVFLHHSFADGECMKYFINCLAGQTRGEPVLDVPGKVTMTLEECGVRADEVDAEDEVEEYTLNTPPSSGPTSPCLEPGGMPMAEIEKTGKIFVFRHERLAELRALVTAHLAEGGDSNENTPAIVPSIYTCLATLAWVHASRARRLDPNTYTAGKAAPTAPARLQTMVNWKKRAFPSTTEDYFGNATSIAITKTAVASLLAAASASDLRHLANLTASVSRTIASVDTSFVARRARLISRASDPRTVGLRFDPRTEQDLGFNTWRWFGADAVWAIPGVEDGRGARAESVRRPQDVWNMSGAVIMPAREEATELELLVTLPRTSMEVLCADEGWMRWVERVVG